MNIAHNSFVSQTTYESTEAPMMISPIATTQPTITYHYPLTFAAKLQPSYTGYIHYSFPGKENEPNITIQSHPAAAPTRFVSKDLYIFSRIHDFPNTPEMDGELVIAHEPLTNGDKPFYMCFPLNSTAAAPKSTIYDLMMDEESKNTEIDLMGSLDGSTSAAYYYETPYAIIAVARDPIQVPASFVGFNRGKIQDLWETPRDVTIARLQKLGATQTHPLAWITATPATIPPIREGLTADRAWKDGMCDGSYCYFDCDYTTPEFENEVPTYMIKAGSDNITLKEKSLNYAMSSIWFMVILVLTVWLGPFLFSVIGSRALGNTQDRPEQMDILDSIEGGIGQLLFIPAIVLISVGVPKQLNCGPKDDACVKAANEMIVPGSILLALWICYAGAMFIYKVFIPDFIGYRDPVTKTEPFFVYGQPDIHIRQYFNPMSLIMMVGRFFI